MLQAHCNMFERCVFAFKSLIVSNTWLGARVLINESRVLINITIRALICVLINEFLIHESRILIKKSC